MNCDKTKLTARQIAETRSLCAKFDRERKTGPKSFAKPARYPVFYLVLFSSGSRLKTAGDKVADSVFYVVKKVITDGFKQIGLSKRLAATNSAQLSPSKRSSADSKPPNTPKRMRLYPKAQLDDNVPPSAAQMKSPFFPCHQDTKSQSRS